MRKQKSYDQLLNEAQKSGIAWQPGMQLRNANGAIDSGTLGYEYTIQTTSLIRAHVIEQKFYEIPFAEYVPVVVGEGAYLENIKTNIQYDSAGDFEGGIQAVGQETRIANVQVGLAPINAKIETWVKGYTYSDLEIEKALASDNWNVIEGKQRALKRNWDLGIQKVCFLGTLTDPTGLPGLLTSAQVTIDTTTIPTNISSMSYTQFGTLVSLILAVYFSNSNSTALPTHFGIPMTDYLGLMTPISPQFPNTSMLEYLENAFKRMCGPGFTIYGNAYADAANNVNFINGASGKYRYVLYRKDPDVIRMDLPIDFVLRAPMSANNFNWNGVALGQFTGSVVYRAPEIQYFDHS